MRKVITYSLIIIISLFCRNNYNSPTSMCGTFEGEGGRNSSLSSYVLLELNADNTCLLIKTFDLSKVEGRGEWSMLSNDVIELKFNNNPVLSDIEKALIGGSYIEGTITIKVMSKNKLQFDNIVLKRIKRKLK